MSLASGTFEVLRDPTALAKRVAQWMTELASAGQGDFAIALSGGSTPRGLYQMLAGECLAKSFPWSRAHWFWGDERFVPHQDPLSNFHMAWEALLSRVPVSASHIHAVPTEGLTPGEAAMVYEDELKRFYGLDRLVPARPLFDIVLLGLGLDGHTASLFPDSSALDEHEHWAVPIETREPARITLTYPALESCAHAAFLIAGAEKCAALRGLLEGDQDLPAARFRPEGELRFFVDSAAAS